MRNVTDYINSGILELYVMGSTTPEESREVEDMSAASSEIQKEIRDIEMAIESYAEAHAIAPSPTIKPFLLAIIDYTERLKNGEKPTFPPAINLDSKIADYTSWINRQDMIMPPDFKDFYAKIIGYTTEILTAIVWIEHGAPTEVHDKEFEKFLILEGTCDITIEDDVHHLVAGDILNIPLYRAHVVKVTSDIPCKVLLQRAAA